MELEILVKITQHHDTRQKVWEMRFCFVIGEINLETKTSVVSEWWNHRDRVYANSVFIFQHIVFISFLIIVFLWSDILHSMTLLSDGFFFLQYTNDQCNIPDGTIMVGRCLSIRADIALFSICCGAKRQDLTDVTFSVL